MCGSFAEADEAPRHNVGMIDRSAAARAALHDQTAVLVGLVARCKVGDVSRPAGRESGPGMGPAHRDHSSYRRAARLAQCHCERCGFVLLEAFHVFAGPNLPMAETKADPIRLAGLRPLSPHLQIYSPLLTMMMSIMHRITGVALYAGTLLLAWYLIALAAGPGPFATLSAVYGSIVGQIVLFGFTWALFHHLLGGIRHFVWDMGIWMDHPEREWLTRMTLGGGLLLALIVWILRFAV